MARANRACSKVTNLLKKVISLLLSVLKPSEYVTIGEKTLRLVKLIGEGGFSFVYLVKDSSDGKVYALKRIRAQDTEQLQKAITEVDVHRQLDHPNLLPLIDSSVTSGQENAQSLNDITQERFVLMLFPYYPRGNLADIRNRMAKVHKYFSEPELVQIFLQICRGLEYLHKHEPSWSHRDLKLENVLLDESNIPVLMDFGSTSVSKMCISSRGQALELQEWAAEHCTMSYRSPELFDVPSHIEIDERTDIWSLGCLLYAMAFGASPFEKAFYESGGSVALSVVSGKFSIPKKSEGNPYSPAITRLIRKMLQKDLLKRPFLKEIIKETDALLVSNPGSGGQVV